MAFRIMPDLLDCVIYLYPDWRSAKNGEKIGGSGFIAAVPIPENNTVTLWAVTNRHIIEGGNWTIRINRRNGGFDTIDTTDLDWVHHPDGADISVCSKPIVGYSHQYYYLRTDDMLTEEAAETYNIGHGDACFTVGRFISQDGKQRNVPTCRFGQIAQPPDEPIVAEGHSEKSYLVEIRSIGGFSGSPVFVYLSPGYARPGMKIRPENEGSTYYTHLDEGKVWLLGIDWCMLKTMEPVSGRDGKPVDSGYHVVSNTGIMGVTPAWNLRSLLLTHPRIVERHEACRNESRS